MKLLLLNENPVVTKLVTLSAQKTGDELAIASSVENVQAGRYDLLIVDDGSFDEAAMESLREKVSSAKTLFMGARGKELPSGFDTLLNKPFLPTDLVELFAATAKEIPKESAPLKEPEDTGLFTVEEEFDENMELADLDALDEFDIAGLDDETAGSAEEPSALELDGLLDDFDLEDTLGELESDDEESLELGSFSDALALDDIADELQRDDEQTGVLDKDELEEVQSLLEETDEEMGDIELGVDELDELDTVAGLNSSSLEEVKSALDEMDDLFDTGDEDEEDEEMPLDLEMGSFDEDENLEDALAELDALSGESLDEEEASDASEALKEESIAASSADEIRAAIAALAKKNAPAEEEPEELASALGEEELSELDEAELDIDALLNEAAAEDELELPEELELDEEELPASPVAEAEEAEELGEDALEALSLEDELESLDEFELEEEELPATPVSEAEELGEDTLEALSLEEDEDSLDEDESLLDELEESEAEEALEEDDDLAELPDDLESIEDEIESAMGELSEEDFEQPVDEEMLLGLVSEEEEGESKGAFDEFDMLDERALKVALGEAEEETLSFDDLVEEEPQSDEISVSVGKSAFASLGAEALSEAMTDAEVVSDLEEFDTMLDEERGEKSKKENGVEALQALLSALSNKEVAKSLKGMNININISFGDKD